MEEAILNVCDLFVTVPFSDVVWLETRHEKLILTFFIHFCSHPLRKFKQTRFVFGMLTVFFRGYGRMISYSGECMLRNFAG